MRKPTVALLAAIAGIGSRVMGAGGEIHLAGERPLPSALRYRLPGVPASQNGNGRISGVRAAKRMARKRRNQQRAKGRK